MELVVTKVDFPIPEIPKFDLMSEIYTQMNDEINKKREYQILEILKKKTVSSLKTDMRLKPFSKTDAN
jgi:hypothetical protein